MKDYLLDIVKHTHSLGFISLVKVTGTDKTTTFEGLAEDRSVILQATTKTPVADFMGTFGMPNLDKLGVILRIPEYAEDAKISINKQDRNGESVPVGIAFENAYKMKPNIKLHKSFDGSHPSMLGTYLASCVVLASITQKTPKGIHYNYFNKISDADKKFLQDIAHMTVESFFDLEL